MTIATTFYIRIDKATEKGWLDKDGKELFELNKNDYSEIEKPVFSKKLVYVVTGYHYDEENDCCDAEDAKYNDWEYCPHCGSEIQTYVFKTFDTEAEAEKSEYFVEFGMSQKLAVTARRSE